MPKRATEKLTKRLIDAAEPNPAKDFTIWDRDLPGFGLRVRETGTKSFLIKYRNVQGRQRKLTLGPYGALTPESARRLAMKELGKVAQGDDPSSERQKIRQARTISELCDVYFHEASAGRVLYRGKPKKAGTLRIDQGRIERHIKPLLGNKSIGSLSRKDIEAFMFDVQDGATASDIKTGPRGLARVRGGIGTAVKAVKLLSAIYNFAIKKGWAENNPCHGIEKPADGRRDRYLNKDEYARLGKALVEAHEAGFNSQALNAIKLIALTGCRKGEILSLEVSAIDFEGNCLRFSDTKTGAQMRPIGKTVFQFLKKTIGNSEGGHVFPAQNGEGHLTDISRVVDHVREISGLSDVTLHILRHSYATVAHELGYSELTISGLLGHAQGTVTSRYAHHVDHALASAADEISEIIKERMHIQC